MPAWSGGRKAACKRYYERIKNTPEFKEKIRNRTKAKYARVIADPELRKKVMAENLEYYHQAIKPDPDKMDARRLRIKGYQQNARDRKQEIRKALQALLGSKCKHCGIDDFRLLDFDHIDPMMKGFNISAKLHLPLDELKEEVAKCQLLCCNCHRLKTFHERQFDWRIRRK